MISSRKKILTKRTNLVNCELNSVKSIRNFLFLFTFFADLEPLEMIGAGYLEICYKSLKPRHLLWEISRMSNTRFWEKIIDLNRKYIHDICIKNEIYIVNNNNI